MTNYFVRRGAARQHAPIGGTKQEDVHGRWQLQSVSPQRLWRTITRRKLQMTRLHVRMQNQLESLLEEAHIKLSCFVTDLLGVSARRMLRALADGETDPAALAALADKRLRAPRPSCVMRWALARSST